MPAETVDFQEIYSEFQPKLYRYFVRVAGESDAEDLTQETMVKVSRGLKRFRGESSLSTWIYSIATNVVRDRFRSAAHKADAVTETADDEELSSMVGDTKTATGSLEHITVRKEMNTWIRSFIDGLPEEYRVPLVLKDLEGFTNPEIADILGLSVDNVKIRLHRARETLKESLEQGCDFHRDQEDEFGCELKESDK